MGEDLHRLEIVAVDDWAGHAADSLMVAVEEAISSRGRCLLGLSGGSTPGPVFVELASRSLDWDRVVIVQIDERLAPEGGPERNLNQQRQAFADLPVTWLPLPVEDVMAALADDPPNDEAVARILADFTAALISVGDDPPVLDIAQLGLGHDGHTASLVPDDPVLDELRHYVALTQRYEGTRRLTLTRPVLDRARMVLWLVRGTAKAQPLGRLLAGDLSMPAGLVRPQRSVIVADTDAARQA